MRNMLTLRSIVLGLAVSGAVGAVENANVMTAADAPTVSESTPFRAVITLRNPHDRAVRIDRLDPSCTCAELQVSEKFLLPHGSATMAITVLNANKSGPRSVPVTVFFTDPELEPIEVNAWWIVQPHIAVDSLLPGTDPLLRPAELGQRDIYRFESEVRPDEPNRLRRRIRLESTDGGAPGGLAITSVAYSGPLWRFTPVKQDNSSWLIAAAGRTETDLPEGDYKEQVVITTNHPLKPTITLHFNTQVTRMAGRHVQPGEQP